MIDLSIRTVQPDVEEPTDCDLVFNESNLFDNVIINYDNQFPLTQLIVGKSIHFMVYEPNTQTHVLVVTHPKQILGLEMPNERTTEPTEFSFHFFFSVCLFSGVF